MNNSKIKKLRWFGLVGSLLIYLLSLPAAAFELLSGDFRQILDGKTDRVVVWQYTHNPKIYVFDMPGLAVQGRTFNRITQFTEQQQQAPYLKVLSDLELDTYITALRRTQADFAFGHDVLVAELVNFYNYARRDNVNLNPEELALKDFLVTQGFIRDWRGFYQALQPEVVILSVPQIQEKKEREPRITMGARYTILLHEMSHGEYYTNPFYAKYVQQFWYSTLSDAQKGLFRSFLEGFNYAVWNEELVINEMQAYLMFTHDAKSFSAKRLKVTEEELARMRHAFRIGNPPTKLPLFALEDL